jgi:hypothetical protein
MLLGKHLPVAQPELEAQTRAVITSTVTQDTVLPGQDSFDHNGKPYKPAACWQQGSDQQSS